MFFGQEVVVLVDIEGFAVETGEGVEEANVVEGVGFEFALLKDAEDVGKSDLDEGFLEFRTVSEFGHFGAVFTEKTEFIAPFLVTEVALIAVVFPTGDVDFEEFVGERWSGGLLEFFDDGFVGDAVVEHLVDLVAEDFG